MVPRTLWTKGFREHSFITMFILFHRYLQGAYTEGRGRPCWIVGSFPSVLIREAQGKIRYERDVDYFYGSWYNRFWTLLSRLASPPDNPPPSLSKGWQNKRAVEERVTLLAQLQLGITDLYETIQTQGGTADTDISNPTSNPYLPDIISHPATKALAATSLFVAKEVGRLLQSQGFSRGNKNTSRSVWIRKDPRGSHTISLILLPSPSPRNRKKLEDLIEPYRVLLSFGSKTSGNRESPGEN